MKRLRFSEPLSQLILKGEKTATWRINDEKNIGKGDLLSLCRINGEEFTRAKVTGVRETFFGKLTKDDKEGHEKFSSDVKMYETYSRYYNLAVVPHTPLKVIKFRLL